MPLLFVMSTKHRRFSYNCHQFTSNPCQLPCNRRRLSRTETCSVLVTGGKHTSAQEKPRQWYHRQWQTYREHSVKLTPCLFVVAVRHTAGTATKLPTPSKHTVALLQPPG